MAGRELSIDWNGRRVAAWVPDLLSQRQLSLSEATARLTERAAAAIRRGEDSLPDSWEALGRLLLRAEGLASSYVEGVRAPPAEVVAAELRLDASESAMWVADNTAATFEAIGHAHARGPLNVETLHGWHTRLMSGASHLPRHSIGAYRDAPGWIGGTSPLNAALVVPPPELIGVLMADVIAFANRADVDPVTQAGVLHAQFELIHPYADGNGRVGRMLIAWVLARRLKLALTPPVSVKIATDRGGYLSGLTLFRLGQADQWIAWFAGILEGSGEAVNNLASAVSELGARWSDRLKGVRSDAVAHRILPLLPARPLLDARIVAQELDVSERAARTALGVLAQHRIVEPFERTQRGPGRPSRWWVATELLSLVSAWAR